ncbi:MAG: protein translocase subunit SecD [Pedosphaera sp.]|nr:protein translocase subunit SecD [Pedosphaera sp.]
MNRNLFWRFAFVVFVVAWSLWSIYPPQSSNLIEVFRERAVTRGESNAVATVRTIAEEAYKLDAANPTRTFANLQQAISTNDITPFFPFIKASTEADPNKAILQKLQQQSAGKIKLGLDLQGGTSFLVRLKPPEQTGTNKVDAAEARERVLGQAVEVLRRRVDRFGVAEPIIQPEGEDQIRVQLPGLSEADIQSAKAQIQKPAFLEFRLVHPESSTLVNQGLTRPNHEVLRIKRKDKDGIESVHAYLVKKKPEKGLTGAYVSRAYVQPDPMTGVPGISLAFNAKGAELFSEVTKENVGRFLAIVLDGELYSAPQINEPIPGGTASITGDFSLKEALELANVLENPLEASLDLMEETSVEPSLGKDNIRSGVMASIVGTAAVSIFMMVYYLFSGLVANVALITNIIILLGVMCSVGTTLTLPGIAGVVLTVGMAVDANVLIYERLREELAKGKSLKGAIAAGYDRAFSTIFDSHVTTLISSIILILLGTGSVKGFGVALTIGVAASLFTALVVTRIIFDWMMGNGWLKKLSMLHFIRNTNLDFMKLAKPAFTVSWLIILIGIGYGISRGKSTMGIDFAGGDRVTLGFDQGINTEDYRTKIAKALEEVGVKDAIIGFSSDFGSGKKSLNITTAIDEGSKARTTLIEKFPEAKFKGEGVQKVGATVGAEIQRTAILASLLSLFGILVYVAFRYEFSFAVGAVIAIIHDVLMTIGCYCLSGRQFDATTVAALLTIIGFSINDTIVIFDRIREDLKLGVRGSFRDLINQALNQTLSRTIITSGTVFLSTMALYLFGGGAINGFAFTFLVGIITGTYSSIYIASALVLWWHKGQRPISNTSHVVMENRVEAAKA